MNKPDSRTFKQAPLVFSMARYIFDYEIKAAKYKKAIKKFNQTPRQLLQGETNQRYHS